MAALRPHNSRRKSHALEIAVSRVGDLDRRIAENRVVNPRLHSLDFVLPVDAPDVLVLPVDRERDFGSLVGRHGRGVIRCRGLEETMWRRPDFHGPFLDGRRLSRRRRCRTCCAAGRRRKVPRERAVDDLDRTLFRRCRADSSGLDDLTPCHLDTRRWLLVVDDGGEPADLERRPGQGRVRCLSELEPASGAGVLDRLDCRRAERVVGRLKRSRLWAAGGCRTEDGEAESQN